jgi:hypothetical protein
VVLGGGVVVEKVSGREALAPALKAPLSIQRAERRFSAEVASKVFSIGMFWSRSLAQILWREVFSAGASEGKVASAV